MRRGIAAKRLGTAKFSSLANAREHFLHGADHGSTTWTSTRDVGASGAPAKVASRGIDFEHVSRIGETFPYLDMMAPREGVITDGRGPGRGGVDSDLRAGRRGGGW